MPLTDRREYRKKQPFRDATLFVIICEGERREPEYFSFFDRLSSRIKVKTVPCKRGKSAPNHLLSNAHEAYSENAMTNNDQLWIVLEKDRWSRKSIESILQTSRSKPIWNVAISNPCFEVWLYFHFTKTIPEMSGHSGCQAWKEIIPQINPGGFDCSRHPVLIETATLNAKNNYSANGYFPGPGSTQVYELAEKILTLIKNEL
jgi:hypothetical protein